MAPTLFPQEILDLFISTLVSDASESDLSAALKACALVSKSFSASAQAHLFSTIHLEYDFSNKATFRTVQNLREVLEGNQRLAANVRVFEVYFKNIKWSSITSWYGANVDEVALPSIMDVLARAQSPLSPFKFGSAEGSRRQIGKLNTLGLGGYNGHETAWSLLHSNFQRAWERLIIASPGLSTLRLRTIRQYPLNHIFFYIPQLQRLEMSQYTFNGFQDRLPRLPRRKSLSRIVPPRPRLLELKTDDSITETEMYGPQDTKASREIPNELFGSLEVVECYLVRSWPHVYVDIVSVCAQTIKLLKITSPRYTDMGLPIFDSLDLGTLPALRELVFELRHDVPYCWFRMPSVLDLLERSTPNTIHTLRIDILTDSPASQLQYGLPEFVQHPQTEIFERLDRILSGNSFAALVTLHVRLVWPALTLEIPKHNPTLLPIGVEFEDLMLRLPHTYEKLGVAK
ncbi:hypothetical protein BDN70DRAFT_997743 [Pholiota conissans]|uniref:F-box domain-containing protein n=1 Tax=Pholiota conissans TaxID=109636 RepID=A0A9P5YQH5_9AGAR|nr:hypothetical protein BDN70DRAFT_997743 [Pholiota conissans]